MGAVHHQEESAAVAEDRRAASPTTARGTGLASASAVGHLHPAARVGSVLSLQRQVGNRAVGAMLANPAQRACACNAERPNASVQRDDGPTPTLGTGSGDATQLDNSGRGKNSWTKFDVKPTVSAPVFDDETFKPVYQAVDAQVTASGEVGHETEAQEVDTDNGADGNVSDARVTWHLQVTLPKWTKVDKQCAAVKAAWNGMLTPLTAHEQKHVDIDKKNLADAHKVMLGQPPADAHKKLDALEATDQAAQVAYDTQSAHGKNEGVVLNYASCELEKVPSSTDDGGPTPE